MSETLRIGINTRTFTVDEPGGAVQAPTQLVHALSARADTEIVLFGHPSVKQQFPNLPLDSTGYVVDSQLYGVAWERAILPRRASLSGVDVLLAPNGNGPLHETPYPTVVWLHETGAIQGRSAGLHRLYRQTTVPRVVSVADIVTTNAEFSKTEIVESLPVESGDVRVMHNGLSKPYLDAAQTGATVETPQSVQGDQQSMGANSPVTAETRHAGSNIRETDLPEQYVLFVGSINPRKNIGGLIEAFAQLKRDTTLPHELVMAGPSPKRIFQQIDVDAADERDAALTSVGFVSDAELRTLYENAACFAFPSLYEGFGIPPLEAMAMGTPVVTSNTTALPEVCGDAAMLVDPHDISAIREGIETVLTDDELSDTLTNRGRVRAQQYTWDKAADQMMEIAREVTETESPA
jgi:Glycosyltransferase